MADAMSCVPFEELRAGLGEELRTLPECADRHPVHHNGTTEGGIHYRVAGDGHQRCLVNVGVPRERMPCSLPSRPGRGR